MINISHICYDVNTELDWREQRKELWEYDRPEIPAQFDRLVEGGMHPEDAADVVDYLADDGFPVCTEPPDVAADGELVVVWPTMYAEAA